MKEIFIVACGSFIGGGLRYGVSKLMGLYLAASFPWATWTVNILGCLLIGFISALPVGQGLNVHTRLFLTTGFCGGFTTFSTFMNESTLLMKTDQPLQLSLYIFSSLAIGMLAVVAGNWLGKMM